MHKSSREAIQWARRSKVDDWISKVVVGAKERSQEPSPLWGAPQFKSPYPKYWIIKKRNKGEKWSTMNPLPIHTGFIRLLDTLGLLIFHLNMISYVWFILVKWNSKFKDLRGLENYFHHFEWRQWKSTYKQNETMKIFDKSQLRKGLHSWKHG